MFKRSLVFLTLVLTLPVSAHAKPKWADRADAAVVKAFEAGDTKIRVIVKHQAGAQNRMAGWLRKSKVKVHGQAARLGMYAIELTSKQVEALALNPDTVGISIDAP